MKKSVQIITIGREFMGKGKKGKKKKIRKGIGKTKPKIKSKKKKGRIISKGKGQTKGNGLFQPFFKVFIQLWTK